ncbi:MAG TPA: ABC transporter substrate-binding protein [Polyangia bacterium]|nr:ABC transporter substrate-binding protein [Polyangia bacterium]
MRAAVYAVLLFAACAASGQTAPALPGTFGSGEPLPAPVVPEPGSAASTAPAIPAPAGNDPGGDADFAAAKARFDAGDAAAARPLLQAFHDQHAQHPARPAADLMLARLALARGDAETARGLLEPLTSPPPDEATGASARYYLGLAEARLGQFARARELLLPFLPPAGAAGPGDEALCELRGALAEATAGVGDAPAAIELWDAYARGGREPEKAYARERIAALAGKLAPDVALQTFRAAPPKGLARALLADGAAGALQARGDAAGAAEIASEGSAARRAGGLDTDAERGSTPGDPARLGLELALSGKFQPVGEAALRAAMLATGAPAASAMELEVRDPGADRVRAQQRLDDLAADAVIGVVMAFDPREEGGIPLGGRDGLPALMLDNGAPAAGQASAFALVHSSAARAAALATTALGLGARSFALVGPDTSVGKALRAAFKKAVADGGGRVTADVSYPPGSTSFGGVVAAVKKTQPQVVFVADGADRLELVAPALAAADLWAAPWGAARPAGAPGKPKPRNVLLLSTAADLSPRLLQSAGRYVQGALLAPGFYASAADPRARGFVDAYRAAYGQDPHATEAYAYDGVNAVRAAIAAGARTRADLTRALGEGTFPGLTGALRFGPTHERADAPVVYVVDGEEIKPLR